MMARKAGGARLDRAAVVQAAVELLDSEGPQGLSLKALAARLGVQTPSLYNHVAGMPGLLGALALRNAEELAACMGEAAMGRSGAAAVMAVAEAYRGYIKRHAGLYMASLRAAGTGRVPGAEGSPGPFGGAGPVVDAGVPGPLADAGAAGRSPAEAPGKGRQGQTPRGAEELAAAEERVVRIVLAVLLPFGLEGVEAVHAVRGLRSLVHGFATLEVAGGFGLPLDCDESFRRLVDWFVAGLAGGAGARRSA
jgi:AcrR family transcriptional regulator